MAAWKMVLSRAQQVSESEVKSKGQNKRVFPRVKGLTIVLVMALGGS